MDNRQYVVNVDGVVVVEQAYLLIERSEKEEHAAGELGFPGGTVETDSGNQQSIEDTIIREMHEEVGVDVCGIEYLCSSTFEADDGTLCLNIVVLCEHVGGEAYPRAKDEVAAVHWLSYDDLSSRADVPPYTLRFAELAEERRTTEN